MMMSKSGSWGWSAWPVKSQKFGKVADWNEKFAGELFNRALQSRLPIKNKRAHQALHDKQAAN